VLFVCVFYGLDSKEKLHLNSLPAYSKELNIPFLETQTADRRRICLQQEARAVPKVETRLEVLELYGDIATLFRS
jgi:hypothetical protein